MKLDVLEKGKELQKQIGHCLDKIGRYQSALEATCSSSYSDDEINVELYNGGTSNRSIYIDRRLVADMLKLAIAKFEELKKQYEEELEQL